MTNSVLSPREQAYDLLEKFSDEYGQVSFPVDSVAIATALGANVFAAESVSAATSVSSRDANGEINIILNKQYDEQIQSIACAQQIKELLSFFGTEENFGIRMTRRFSVFNDEDEFAMELIMPASTVRRFYGEAKSLRKMAKIFGVPKHVMNDRLITLGLP